MRVIYIHGFNSSEQSYKAQAMREWLKGFDVEYVVPRLHYDPRLAMMQLEQLIEPNTKLIGSSLGGFYATYLSQRYHLDCVVINPVVRPSELLKGFLGPQYNPYQDCHYKLDIEHVTALDKLYLPALPEPWRVLLLQQMGDEVLPYQAALNYYQTTQQYIDFQGDHSFQGLQRYFPAIVKFLKIT
ncbi:Putative esterase, FIGfam005057 [Pseudoalteromonas luteoviolacea B = ATCC 29581]|nr:Putative esterase, FIGfam005057 [Pseudoalteromonas luteoviolacea B = ATCC 29581]